MFCISENLKCWKINFHELHVKILKLTQIRLNIGTEKILFKCNKLWQNLIRKFYWINIMLASSNNTSKSPRIVRVVAAIIFNVQGDGKTRVWVRFLTICSLFRSRAVWQNVPDMNKRAIPSRKSNNYNPRTISICNPAKVDFTTTTATTTAHYKRFIRPSVRSTN